MSFLTKIVNHFWQSVDAILKDGYVTETVVWCKNIIFLVYRLSTFKSSKNYGSPTHVTRLKVAPNMAGPIRKETVALKTIINRTFFFWNLSHPMKQEVAFSVVVYHNYQYLHQAISRFMGGMQSNLIVWVLITYCGWWLSQVTARSCISSVECKRVASAFWWVFRRSVFLFYNKMCIGNNLNLILNNWKVIGSYLKPLTIC